MKRQTNRKINHNASRRGPFRIRITNPDGTHTYLEASVRRVRAQRKLRTVRAHQPTAVLLEPEAR